MITNTCVNDIPDIPDKDLGQYLNTLRQSGEESLNILKQKLNAFNKEA